MCDNQEAIRSVMDSVREFIIEMKEENDRAAVIIGAANVEFLLKRLIELSLLPRLDKKKDDLLDGDSPLSTFSSKINLCYRLALIDKDILQLLHILKKIRNDFAHKIRGCDLNSPPHSDQVNELTKHLKGSPLLEKLRRIFPGDAPSSRDFRIILSLISALLEMKISHLPNTIKANPISIAWIPIDVEV
jgi:DNA-binding MltR family transcriptional regulator